MSLHKRDSLLFNTVTMAMHKVVEHDHPIPSTKQSSDGMHPDIAGSAGYKDQHQSIG